MRKINIELYGANYTLYENGDIYGKNGKLSVRANEDGYAVVTVGKKGNRCCARLHRLVGTYFVENPYHYLEIDHIDRDRMNPNANNLRWTTRKENVSRCKHRNICGDKNPNAKLDSNTALAVRKEFRDGVTQYAISKKYNIPWSTVHNIIKRNTWKYQY